jgi:hypothetical protein
VIKKEVFMETKCSNRQFFATNLAVFAIAGVLLPFSGCTTSTAKHTEEKDVNRPASSSASDHSIEGGTYCVQTMIQGPPPPHALHFTNKITESDQALKSKDFETDLSGDTLDVIHHAQWLATEADQTFFEQSRKFDDPKIVTRAIRGDLAEETITNHYSRSDASGWRIAVSGLAQGATPWNLFLSRPHVNRLGNESVNDYDTIKYAVDTTQESKIDKAALLMSERLNDYNITGTTWILKDSSCVLQYNLDFEQVSRDGKVSKTHYEGNVTKE